MSEKISKIINWIEMSYTRLNYKEELLLVNYIKQLQQENKELQQRINKAIEYMKNIDTYNYFDKGKKMFRREEDLLEILKGVE